MRTFEQHFPEPGTQALHGRTKFNQLCDDVERSHSTGELTDEEYQALRKVTDQAKDGQWDRAKKALDSLLAANPMSPPPSAVPVQDPVAPPQAGTFAVKGSMPKSENLPSATGMVALLFDVSDFDTFKRLRDAIVDAQKSSRDPWRAIQDFQNFVQQLQSKPSNMPGAQVDTLGQFDFSNLPGGRFFITVGIPPKRDRGRTLPHDWPPLTTCTLIVAGRELIVPAHGGWFKDVLIQGEDRSDVSLDRSAYFAWPAAQPSPQDLHEIRSKQADIQRKMQAAETAKKAAGDAEKIAKESFGQPLQVMKMRAETAKAEKTIKDCNEKIEELYGLLSRLAPPAQDP